MWMSSFVNHELLNKDYDLKATIMASIVLLSAEILCLFGIAVVVSFVQIIVTLTGGLI
jgi:hypothetical protein